MILKKHFNRHTDLKKTNIIFHIDKAYYIRITKINNLHKKT